MMKFLFIFFFIMLHHGHAETLLERLKSPSIGVHRGGGLSPERNTLAQFEKAYRAGADIVEMDLRLARDGVVMVFHDQFMSKSTNCIGPMAWYTSHQLKNCRFKTNSESIPTFEEVLKWSHGKIVINAEFKAQKTIKPAIQLAHQYRAIEWTYFQTQNRRESYRIARKYSKNVFLIFHAKKLIDIHWAIERHDPRLFALELHKKLHHRKIIRYVQKHQKLVSGNSFQVVSDRETSGVAGCHVLLKLGIDILITDLARSCIEQTQEYLSKL